jgi:hypothetical protein
VIRRTYGCNECNLEWTVTHDSSDEPYPPCPVCTIKATWRPKPLRIKTNRSRAMDVAQSVAEGMGLSNMKDNTREGESVYMAPSAPTTTENEAVMHQTVDAMRQLANRSAGTISKPMADFLSATGQDLSDPTKPMVAPSELIGTPSPALPAGPSNVTPLHQSPAFQTAKLATAQAKQLTGGESPTGMLHKAMKHQKSDPLRSQIMARYRP